VYADLKKIATLEFGKEVERLSIEKEQKLREGRSIYRPTGLAVRSVLDVELEYSEAICRAYAKIWLDLLEEKHNGVLTRQHVEFIGEEIRSSAASRKSGLLNGPSGQQFHSSGGHIARRMDAIVASICRDLEIRISRQEAGLSKEPQSKDDRVNVTIHSAANVNLGSQVGTINATLNAVADQSDAHRELAAAIRELTNAILQSQNINNDDKQAAFQVISTLAKEAQVKPEERSTGTLKALIAGFPSIIGQAADITTLWMVYVPMIRTFFGI
jgi:hypothetical protein